MMKYFFIKYYFYQVVYYIKYIKNHMLKEVYGEFYTFVHLKRRFYKI